MKFASLEAGDSPGSCSLARSYSWTISYDFLLERLAAYKVPRVVEFREELPVSGAGKVLRRMLKGGML